MILHSCTSIILHSSIPKGLHSSTPPRLYSFTSVLLFSSIHLLLFSSTPSYSSTALLSLTVKYFRVLYNLMSNNHLKPKLKKRLRKAARYSFILTHLVLRTVEQQSSVQSMHLYTRNQGGGVNFLLYLYCTIEGIFVA